MRESKYQLKTPTLETTQAQTRVFMKDMLTNPSAYLHATNTRRQALTQLENVFLFCDQTVIDVEA